MGPNMSADMRHREEQLADDFFRALEERLADSDRSTDADPDGEEYPRN